MIFIGHQKIIKILEKSLENEKISQAYLFYGPENVGKFTLAKIFAECLIKNRRALFNDARNNFKKEIYEKRIYEKIKTIINQINLFQYRKFKLFIMVEVPACALNLQEFINVGIDGISIGTNDLTMMVLGVDRDNETVTDIYDERNTVVVKILKNIIKTC